MRSTLFRIRACAACLLLLPLLAQSAAALKPLVEPDLSALDPQTRRVLVEARAQFDAARPSLVGLYLAEAFARLGGIYARNGQLVAARTAMHNAASVAPDDGRFVYLQGVLAGMAGELPQARDLLRGALALDGNYLPIRYRLATQQLELGELAGARSTIEATATARPDLAPAAALLGEIAMREKRWADADRWFTQALKADPKATALHARRAEALAALGNASAAAGQRKLAGKLTPGYPDPLLESIFAAPPRPPAEQALGLAAAGAHSEAIALLDTALAQQPDDAELLTAYARVEADRGNLAAAGTRADAALKAAPGSAAAHLAKGMVLEVGGNENAARAQYEAAVRADQRYGAARLALGNALMRAQQWMAAADQYREAAALDDSAGVSDRLAAALVLAGRCADALGQVNRLLLARPRDGDLLQTFVRLAATCPAASDKERGMAAEYGQALYKQLPNEANTEALAMAMAAQGRSADAVDYQAQAIFESVKRGDTATAARQRADLDRFKAGQRATQPWPPGHPALAPPRLKPSARAAAG